MSAFVPPYSLDTLLAIMERLRDPEQGCPWDQRQTFDSVVPHSIEEVYEVAEAIRQQNFSELRLELGDLLFQVVFYAQLAKEQQYFDLNGVIDGVCEKLIRRHPHVFGECEFANEAQINTNWEREKAKEREQKSAQSVLDDVPLALPALSRAQKLQKRAANIGFDWPDAEMVSDKVAEELDEVRAEQQSKNQEALAEEIGDLMFACVNLARKHHFDSETLLRRANDKFERRFRQVEAKAKASNKSIDEHTLDELEDYWQQVKCTEKN
ncbi:nucleoside triphosphate pyrophosphohydrolase [Celerinatantimonas yamalensis]|uniref:Nucleoside triphosphate pyrophosphohydrolase n=1 Tax=Celerinatantimonas yamalensis TaxID=559956 RepID=A0ABW9G7U7_9GAMM